jgi:hypothetical protein
MITHCSLAPLGIKPFKDSTGTFPYSLLEYVVNDRGGCVTAMSALGRKRTLIS